MLMPLSDHQRGTAVSIISTRTDKHPGEVFPCRRLTDDEAARLRASTEPLWAAAGADVHAQFGGYFDRCAQYGRALVEGNGIAGDRAPGRPHKERPEFNADRCALAAMAIIVRSLR
mgnify:CR=1 FL=1